MSAIPRFHVLVAGGGYAGQAAAWTLAGHGIKSVLVLDRRGRAGYPHASTSGIATYWLNHLGLPMSASSVAAPIREFRVISNRDAPGTERLLKPKTFGMDMGKVLVEDDYLGKLEHESAARGVTFEHSASFRQVLNYSPANGDYVVEYENGAGRHLVRARWLLDAGGYDARLGRALNIVGKLGPEDHHQGYEISIPNTGQHPEDRVTMWVGSDVAPHGYVWCFPASHDGMSTLRVGIGTPLSIRGEDGRTIPTKTFFDRFLKQHPEFDVKPLSRMGGVIPTARPRKVLHRDLAFVAGDAARLCDSITGGGIHQALRCGVAFGEAVSEGESVYEQKLADVITEMRRRYALKQFLYAATDQELVSVMDALASYTLDGMDVNPYELRGPMLKTFRKRGIHPLWTILRGRRFWKAVAG